MSHVMIMTRSGQATRRSTLSRTRESSRMVIDCRDEDQREEADDLDQEEDKTWDLKRSTKRS